MSQKLNGEKSRALFEKAQQFLPGGVNSPVRAFKAVGGDPFFVEKAKGAHIWDADGNKYIDFMGSWGPLILGHCFEPVIEAVCETAKRGTSFGAPHEGEIELAKLVNKMMPSVEMMRMVSSGTEATMSAIRLARGFTRRDKILKFVGCYHGHADSFLIKAGSGAATFGQPDSPGVTAGTVKDTLTATYNDLDSVRAVFGANKDQIAAIIVEPVAGNMGCVLPKPEFLKGLRSICDETNALLIFDEVITGFRVHPGGAAMRFSVNADLTTLGKVLGGGLPVGAYGGKAEIMRQISPTGPVYQAGTLSGNPLAVAAGLATLNYLDTNPQVYRQLEEKGAVMEQILRNGAQQAGIEITVNRVGSMLGLFFNEGPVNCWEDVEMSNKDQFVALFGGLLGRGISIAPSAFEALFVCAAHTSEDLEKTKTAFNAAMREAALA